MSLGKTIRMKRLIEPQFGSCIVCALDHGMTSPVFLEGLFDTRTRAREAIAGGANVLMLGRGMAGRVAAEFTPATSLALMLSAAAAGRPQGSLVTPIGSVEEAMRLGADAVVVYVALAGENEAARAAVSIAAHVEPRVQHQQAYTDAYALYRDVYAALQEPFRKAAQ